MAAPPLWGRALRRAASLAGLDERRCRVCGHVAASGSGIALCPACRDAVTPHAGGFCPACGTFSREEPAEPAVCGPCREQQRPWRRVMAGGLYDGQLRRMILEYKFSGRLALGAALRGLLLETWRARMHVYPGATLGDTARESYVVVPVPLHAKRLAKRGFNQSLELARPLAHELGVDADSSALVRIRDTKPQMTLTGPERAGNIKGAFRADAARVAGKTALLVDDIFTTGATVAEAASVLIEAGARAVDAVVLARTQE